MEYVMIITWLLLHFFFQILISFNKSCAKLNMNKPRFKSNNKICDAENVLICTRYHRLLLRLSLHFSHDFTFKWRNKWHTRWKCTQIYSQMDYNVEYFDWEKATNKCIFCLCLDFAMYLNIFYFFDQLLFLSQSMVIFIG